MAGLSLLAFWRDLKQAREQVVSIGASMPLRGLIFSEEPESHIPLRCGEGKTVLYEIEKRKYH